MPVAYIDSSEKYKEIINSGKPVVIDFTAAWCGPCKVIAPIYETTSTQNTDSGVEFYKVDIDKQREIATESNIKSVPTFILYKDGQPVAKFSGADPNQLAGLVNQAKGLL